MQYIYDNIFGLRVAIQNAQKNLISAKKHILAKKH